VEAGLQGALVARSASSSGGESFIPALNTNLSCGLGGKVMQLRRKVYLEGCFTLHSICNELTDYPPAGYEFVTDAAGLEKAVQKARKVQLLTRLQIMLEMRGRLPATLVKAYLQSLRRAPKGTALTYAYLHPNFRKGPWVMDLEVVHTLVSNNPRLFRQYKGILGRLLASENCRKILPWSEASKKTLVDNLDCFPFDDKIEVVYLAVRPRDFVKDYSRRGGKIKLLFVGSAYSREWFELKGGREAVEAFLHLGRLYDDVELVIRSDVPANVKEMCKALPNIRIIEGVLPWDALESEYQTADIFILPAHNTPFMVFLEAMSYELPIITTNVFANPEIIQDGKTGLLVEKSKRLRYFVDGLPNWGTPEFMRDMAALDGAVVQGIVEKAKLLIENPELRIRLGKAARQEIEEGRFSIKRRNAKLTHVFDEALRRSQQ
jgi:glycosyltransferase involved in cell wall biosynthesis